jgi:hypothetical protein
LADNTTNLSIAGVVKWLLVIALFPCLIKAWQGIVSRTTATGYLRSDASTSRLLTGSDAVWYGLLNVLYAALLMGAAWAIWFFWQQYED